MAAGARLVTFAVLLLLGVHVPCAAEEADDEPVEIAEPDAEEEAPTHTEDEWKELQTRIMESIPDDEPEAGESSHYNTDDDEGQMKRWHTYKGYPFLEYNGFIEDAPGQEGPGATIHEATLDMEGAKTWCGENPQCAGFTHAGGPTEEPVEMFFKAHWSLSVETEEPWTSYQKGEKMMTFDEEEVESMENPFFHCEIIVGKDKLDGFQTLAMFVEGIGHADTYIGLKHKYVPSQDPELVCFKGEEEVERVAIPTKSSLAKLHVMVEDRGLKRRDNHHDEL